MYSLWILSVLCVGEVFGHGKLWEPPSRSSMWRQGFHTPMNANDNELNCGGYENQWIYQGGRCGVCGDPYQENPRSNEAGGRYATGIITRSYKAGDVIELAADLTANHVGFFEYRVCPVRDLNIPATQECFDKYPVLITETMDGRYHVNATENGVIRMQGRLPPNLSCEHCVLQWRYNTGNRWNCDVNDKCGHGTGPQEEFYGCADISIMENPDSPKYYSERPKHRFEPLENQLRYTLEHFRSISRDDFNYYPTEKKSDSTDIYQTSIVTHAFPEVTTEVPVRFTDSKALNDISVPVEIQPVTVKSAIQSLLAAESATINYKKSSNIDLDALDIKTTKHNGQKVAILEKMSDMLWSMMKSLLLQSNKRNGQNMASVKWDPLKSLGKSPIRNTDRRNRYQFELKSKWPPTHPMIVKADYGIDDIIEGNPIMLSEISPEEYMESPIMLKNNFRSPFQRRLSELDKYRKHTQNLDTRLLELKQKRDKITTTQEMATLKTLVCSGAESFLYVNGINTWCTRNCKAGNCPRHMCRCVNKRVKPTTTSMLTTSTSTTTPRPYDATKPPSLPILSEFTRQRTFKEKISKQPTNVNFLSKKVYMDLYKQNPEIFGQKIKYINKNRNRPRNTRRGGTSLRTMRPPKSESPKKSIICHGADQYGQQSAIKGWCTENCRKGFCPKRVCVCKYG